MAASDTIPTIDLAPLRGGSVREKREVAKAIDAACMDTGFFLVTGHGVAADLIQSTRRRAIEFFALPEAEKMKAQRPPAKISRGYNWLGDRSVAYSMGQVAPPDIQEAFAFGPEGAEALAAKVDKTSAQMYAPNIWPEQPDGFKTTMLAYREAMSGVASDVLRAMALALDTDESYFADKFDRQASVVRIIRYPAVTAAAVARTASRRRAHRLRLHHLCARRRHAGRAAGQAPQRRLDRRPHSAEDSSATSAI